MDSEPTFVPSAVKYFRLLMLGLFLLAASVIAGVAVGWSWFAEHKRTQSVIQDYAETKDAEMRKRAEAAAAREIQEMAPSSDSSDGLPRISLSDMARELSKDATSPEAPAEPITITLPFDPSTPEVRAAEATLKKYLSTSDWRERLSYVYDSERVKPLMQQFYEKQKNKDPEIGTLLNRGRYRLNGTEILHFSYSCSRPGDLLELALRRNGDGDFVLDWTSFVGFSELSWQEFKQHRPTSSFLFRVFASTSDYYNYEFTDQKKYLSVSLLSPDGQISIHGYCEREGEVGKALSRLLSRTQAMSGIIVKLAFPENAESNRCVLITQLVSDRWLLLR